ncbi:MAG: radical SAM protein [Tateyamaria sp.]|uniref:B12-binding domain-containing radical SAM protein n=1 Tax=Tateyamaria sp. TaxID=1929288 RepID=UPI0032A0273C
MTSNPAIRKVRDRMASTISPTRTDEHAATIDEVSKRLEQDSDFLLISAYSMYFDVVKLIAGVAQQKNVPVLVGGPMFTVPQVTEAWLKIPGVSAIYAGEADTKIEEIIAATCSPTVKMSGLYRRSDDMGPAAPPLTNLDALPFADYSDFPWHRYPRKIVPMMTGRGCGWGVCTFCSDVLIASGRSFRTRSLDYVIGEINFQKSQHGTQIFNFIDLKLNSDLTVWKGLAERLPIVAPDTEWTASLHVNRNGDNGLSLQELREANRAGLSRVTTGLESGSNTILNSMARGTSTEALSQFVRYAHEAGLSVRMTSIIGFPGETATQVDETTDFLRRHFMYLDRVVVNRLAISPLTTLWQQVRRGKGHFDAIRNTRLNIKTGLVDHENLTFRDKHHLRAVSRLLAQVHRINRKPLVGGGLTFEGVF